ncbi:MAG: putative Fe-S cluster assembly protein SufT [Verrucomicrobiales bacterium]|jgi:probable FeS assembly SUF system protein SufT|nr:putative Fe-S cluster assembly protein SufT [Verrucomicrobiales bacterium]
MSVENIITLQREVIAVQIPNGNRVTLPPGTAVIVTQSLGGSFTVHVTEPSGLYRVAGEDADALGQARPEETATVEPATLGDKIWAALRTCYDPEIPVNIVDLGLIYSVTISDLPADTVKVNVKMTLTAPGCGMGPAIATDARNKILALKEVGVAEVEVVWDPPWNPGMMTKEGKARLGIAD